MVTKVIKSMQISPNEIRVMHNITFWGSTYFRHR